MSYRKHKKRFVPQVGPRPTAGLVVDASCIAVQNSLQVDGFYHGAVEWQVKDIASGALAFSSQIYQFGNVNLAELLAIIDGVSLLHNADDHSTPIYSDSLTAIAWYRNRKAKTRHPLNEFTYPILDLVDQMMKWLISTKPTNPVLFWDNQKWGENPADYGRK